MGLASNSAYTSTAARDLHRTQQVRLAAIVCSGISVTASFVAFYWFFRMKKLFRHRLIMLLVYGDVMRSVWYFVFAIYSLARGTVKTESRFCQTSGFFIQYGTETSDYAVLAVAVHSALQIFRPAARGTSDGLYDYRIYVFSGAFLIPGMMSALAFVNPGPAYESLGAFCQLPLRPFWYRLALAWIPRYLIAFIILSLAGAIYAYVGCEFRSYANLSQSSMTALSTTVGMSLADGDVETAIEQAQVDRPPSHLPNLSRRASSVAHDVVSTNRRGSTVAFGPTTYAPSQLVSEHVPLTQSLSGSSTYLPLKRTASVRPGLVAIPSGYTVKLSLSALDLQGPISPRTQPMEDPMSTIVPERSSTMIPEHSTKESMPRRDPSPPSAAERHLARQRRRIHRQLRLMFIYPLVYILMWTVPFVQHVINYNNHYANHPLWFTRIGQTICLTSMGFVDCLIFSLREKPWRSISTSDGTLWGSLAVWRNRQSSTSTLARAGGKEANGGSRQRSMTESGANRVARVKNSVRTSASDDYTRMAAEQARIRLDMEKDERMTALTKRMEAGSVVAYKGKEKMLA